MNRYYTARFVTLFSLILISSYLRGIRIEGSITSSYLVVGFAAIGLSLTTLFIARNGTVILNQYWWAWVLFLCCVIISFIFNLFVRPYPDLAVRFVLELFLNIFIFISFLSLLDMRLLESLYQKFLMSSSIAGGVLMFYPIYVGDLSVRRIGGYDLPGAVNNISMMLGVGVVIAIASITLKESLQESKVELITLPPIVIGLGLSGSRAAIIGVVLSVILLPIIKDIKNIRLFVLFTLIIGSLSFALNFFYNWTGFYRFTYQGLMTGVNNRIRVYLKSLVDSGMTVSDLLFGGGMYRYQKFVVENPEMQISTIIYPHNYVISLIVHVGLLSGVLFAYILIRNYRGLLSLSLKSDDRLNRLSTITLLALIVVSMYSFTSGRVTRTFPLWIMIGISEYLLIAYMSDLGEKETLVDNARNMISD